MNTINKITVSGNTYGIVDTDTKVTSAANHYTPSADNNAELTASLSGTAGAYAKDTEYTVLTGVKAQRDAKGHITGLTYTAQKIKDTGTNIANEVMSISTVAISSNTSSSCSITGSGNAGKAQTIIYTNSDSSDRTVTVPTTYKTPDGAAIQLTCPKNGYCEVSYLNIDGTIYARGL